MTKAYRVRITGRVQGVGYRWFARDAANRVGVVGTVKNLPDGSVEAFIQGDEERLRRMIEILKRGPSSARVTDIRAHEATAKSELDDFQITHW